MCTHTHDLYLQTTSMCTHTHPATNIHAHTHAYTKNFAKAAQLVCGTAGLSQLLAAELCPGLRPQRPRGPYRKVRALQSAALCSAEAAPGS